jgi:hypothetical protein
MEFSSSNSGDISRYYKGCFVKFKERGEVLHRIENITSQFVEGINEEGKTFRVELRNEDPYIMSFVLPQKSIFKYRASLYLLEKIPAKQFKRGISDENTKITNLLSGEKAHLSFGILKAYTNKQFQTSLTKAFKTKEATSILTSRFWYKRDSKSLYLDAKVIAQFDDNYKHIFILDSFKEEVEDMLCL